MAIEIVDFPIKNGGSFHCYVSSPEGIRNGVYQQQMVILPTNGDLTMILAMSSHGDLTNNNGVFNNVFFFEVSR